MNSNLPDEEEFSHNDSLQLIEQMITAAKDQHSERGEGWLLWGWLLFGASIASVLLIYTGLGEYVGWAWTAVLPLGLLSYFMPHLKNRKQKTVKTYVSGLLDRIEAGFFISLLVMIIGGNIIGIHQQQYGHYLFGYYYVLYAFWMYIHGSATRFKPLIIGAYFNWAAALLIFFLTGLEYIMMVSAAAVLAGYIIPGYIQRYQYNKSVIPK